MRKLPEERLIDANLITTEHLSQALELQKNEGNLLSITLVKPGCIEDEILLDYLRDPGAKVRV